MSVNAPSVGSTNVSGDVYSSYNDAVQNASAQNSALGSILGTLGTAGVSLATGGLGLGSIGTALGLPGLLGLGSADTTGFSGSGYNGQVTY